MSQIQVGSLILSLALLTISGVSSVSASGHYGGGGGGGSTSLEGRCIRWVKISGSPDGGVSDGGAADGGMSDGGTDGGATTDHRGERCVEHAGLFGCAVAGPGSGAAPASGAGALALLLAFFRFAWYRRRSAARHE